MSMHLVGETPWLVPLVDRGMTSTSIASDASLATPLRECLAALVVAVGQYREAALLPTGG
jgi:hypothetical protein